MTEPNSRDRAVAELGRALRRAGLCIEPDLGDLGLLVDLLIDAAAERVRAGREGRWGWKSGPPGPTPSREESGPVADAGGTHGRAEEDPGRCARCGEPFELIRPGKSQPTCRCWGKDI